MTFGARFAIVVLVGAAGCSKPATTTTPTNAVAPSCPSAIGGSVHDLDNSDAVLAGATVTLGERATLSDKDGTFLVEYATQPLAKIAVHLGAEIGEGTLPACVDKMMWIGVHTRANGAPSALVVRMEDRALDLVAIDEAARRREALADIWLTFYERFADLVDGNRGNCPQMATALEQFVEQNRGSIDSMKQQQAAMSSRERAQFQDTVEQKFAARDAAMEQKTAGVATCQAEPRVRQALSSIPR